MSSLRRILIAILLCVCPAGTAAAQGYDGVQRRSLYVPVRDGTRLAVNIYRPAESGKPVARKLPVIFVFTPYRSRFVDDKGVVQETALNDRLALRSLIRQGYVVAVADIRGKGASFGSRKGFQSRIEAQDGYDLVEWLARQPYSTGKVGMLGCSYLGGTTFHTASTAPPSLKAVFIGASDFDKYDFVRHGGITAQFNTRPDEPASVDLASVPVDGDKGGKLLRAAVAQHDANTPMGLLWYGMPLRDSVSPLTGNAFWQEASIYNYARAITDAGIATYFWGNWHDEPTAQVILGAANLGGKLLVGPGDHCVPPPGFDFTGEIGRYFDHYLKGADTGIEKDPRATYWVDDGAGGGSYVRSNALPGTQSQTLTYYLADGRSDSSPSANDGVLAAAAGPAGSNGFTVNYDLPPVDYFAFWVGPMDAKGLGYTTPVLDSPLRLIGYPVAHLSVAADRPDADVFVYLEQVPAKGEPDVIAFGRLKLSHRKLSAAPYDTLGLPWHSGLAADVAPLPAGEAASLSIVLGPVSRVVPAGARLRLVVTGADPRQRNLKDIMESPPPRLEVRRGWGAGSRIDLPLAQ